MRVLLLLVLVVVVGILLRFTLFSDEADTAPSAVQEVSESSSDADTGSVTSSSADLNTESNTESSTESSTESNTDSNTNTSTDNTSTDSSTDSDSASDSDSTDSDAQMADGDSDTPTFDVVRVDNSGNAVVAGFATPGSTVIILADGAEIARTEADASGNFVALFNVPQGDSPIELRLESNLNGVQISSDDSFIVLPIAPDSDSPPLIVSNTQEDGVRLLQVEEIVVAESPEVSELFIDTIDYGEVGDVIIAGRANADARVRVYITGGAPTLGRISGGSWQVVLPDVPVGLHTLRIEALDAADNITAQIELPFKREIPREGAGAQVTIQPGNTLWGIAYKRYGRGIRYIHIFEANKSQIKDPDLIYPGQIFDIPQINN